LGQDGVSIDEVGVEGRVCCVGLGRIGCVVVFIVILTVVRFELRFMKVPNCWKAIVKGSLMVVVFWVTVLVAAFNRL
jgi:ABC-type glucose/galactose transport system permease subunit